MKDVEIRLAKEADRNEIANLWNLVFRDEMQYIELFLDAYFTKGSAMVLTYKEKIVSAVHLIPLGRFVWLDRPTEQCAAIYAFGTLTEYRGQGFGRALLKEAILQMKKNGSQCNVIYPAEEALFSYYEEQFAYQRFFKVKRLTFSAGNISLKNAAVKNTIALPQMISCEPEDYGGIRAERLVNTPHISFDLSALKLQKRISQRYGGDLYILDYGGSVGCCCVEYQNKTRVVVKEFLGLQEDLALGIQKIKEQFPAQTYEFRLPYDLEVKGLAKPYREEIHFSAMMLRDSLEICEENKAQQEQSGYYGFAFD